MKYHHAPKPSSQNQTNKSAAPSCLDNCIISQQTCQNLYHKMNKEMESRVWGGYKLVRYAFMSGSRRNDQIKWEV